jgi:hypothetical protein
MSIVRPAIIATFLLGTLAACAATDPREEAEIYKAPVYRIGSNLPTGRETGQPAPELTPAERAALEQLQNRPRNPIGLTK